MTVKSVVANLPFIADLPLYSAEKPYTVIPLAGSSTPSAGNVEITQRQVQVGDLRHLGFTLGKNGVQVVNHESKYLDAWDHAAVKAYKKETEAVLREVIPDAEYVLTWDFRRRKNEEPRSDIINLNDELRIDTPAKAAHIDATFHSGPRIIARYLPAELQEKYFRPGFRFRLVNTWRPVVSILEDCPLAVCDYTSMNSEDLIGTDLIYPHRHGEIYHVRYNGNQRWYWHPDQTPKGLYVFLTYDSSSSMDAKYCAHTSFQNPLASKEALTRESIETRSIVVSKVD